MALSYKNFNLDSQKGYSLSIIMLVLIYSSFEFFFISHAGFVRDEFWFGHHIYQYLNHLPYRDFLPYKPVLGYYLLSIPLFFSQTLLAPIYIKYEIASINALFILATAFWSVRFFQPKAIFFTLLIIISSQSFLIISSDLRVDMLSSWLSLLSVLLILSHRHSLAGILLALGFLVSQKALWFFVATNMAFALYWISVSRNKKTVWDIIQFNIATIIPIFVYILFWAHYSSLSTVLNSVFYEGYTQSKITWYRQIYYDCWQTILSSGPLFILLWPLTWLSLFVQTATETIRKQRVFIATYSTCMMLFILSYQQAFPYNMVFAVPPFFLLYSDFFTWMFGLFNNQTSFTTHFSKRQLFWFISTYLILLIGVLISLGLPSAYFQVLFIPLLLGLWIYTPHKNLYQHLIIIALVFTGMIYPLISTSINTISYVQSGDYQQSNLLLANDLLEEGGDYFAGTPLFYQREQAIPGLMNLIGPAVDYLNQPNPALLPILIPSLYLTPRTPEQILQDLKKKPVKLYINNNRIEALPKSIRFYLFSHYHHYWGSIYLYAPQISAKLKSFSLTFTGTYQVESKGKAKIYIDKKIIRPDAKIKLTQGYHLTNSHVTYRLNYLPNHLKHNLSPKHKEYEQALLASI